MERQRESLSKVLGRVDVLAMAFGTMIGWGWVMLTGYWVKQAGVLGAVVAFLIGATMCIFVGLTYAELTPVLPLAEGEMVFAMGMTKMLPEVFGKVHPKYKTSTDAIILVEIICW